MVRNIRLSHVSVRTCEQWQNSWLDLDAVWGGDWGRARIGDWREIHVQRRNKTDATWWYILLRDSVHRHTDAYADTPSRAECHSARLVLNGDNMLGLCDPSNLLLVLSAEERRAFLKLLWGGFVSLQGDAMLARYMLWSCIPYVHL